LDLPKSTARRSLTALADIGWIQPRSDSRWGLGDRIRELSDLVDDLAQLREASLPVLGQLNGDTLETVHLTVREANGMRLVERLDSKHPLRFVKAIGSRSPLHASSSGKSVLARLSAAELDDYLDLGLSGVTTHTLTDRAALLRDLKDVRERGYAIADQELTDGVVSVAACITSERGIPIAAVSVSAPAGRLPADLRHGYGAKVVRVAAEISNRLRP
jgi:IclR family acetate operon transcriptional repressor